jgi:hypothetical protein
VTVRFGTDDWGGTLEERDALGNLILEATVGPGVETLPVVR